MSPQPWPELQPLAARIAVGELDGDEALDAIVDAIVRRELGGGHAPAAVVKAIRAEAKQAVAADRGLVAMLRPVAPVQAAREAIELPPRPAPKVRAPKIRGPIPRDHDDDDLGSAPDPAAFERAQGGRRLTAVLGVTLGVAAGGVIWWTLLRETPCEQFARQVCLELAEPCSAGEVEQHFASKAIDDAKCEATRAAAEAASATAGPSKRSRAYEQSVIESLGFDPRTGEPPVAAAAVDRGPVTPMLLARKLPSLPSLVADEAYVYVSSGEAVLKLRSTGGQFEPIAAAPGGHAVVVTTDFVYWAARGADGAETIYVDRKRGEYEPTAIATAPAKLGASRCTQGACAYVDTTDGAVWIALQDGTAPKKLTAAQTPAPTEVWIDETDVAYVIPGPSASIVAVPTVGGTARVVAGAETAVTKLWGDAEAWFWIAGGGALRTMPRAGGDIATLVPSGVTAFAVDKTRAFVGDATAGTIVALPRAGGGLAPIIGEQVGLEHVVVDPAAVFWTRGGDLLRLPK